MNNGAKLGAGVAGGYLLGRTKKLKLAVGLGAWLLGKRLDLSPSKLAMQGFGQLKDTPEFAELSDRLRSEVGGAGKKALAAAATSRMEALADRLQDRNEGVYDDEPRGQDDEDYDDDEDDGESDLADEEMSDEPYPDEPRTSQRRGSSRRGSSSSGSRKRTAAASSRRRTTTARRR